MPRIPAGLVDRENATLVELVEAPAPQLPAVIEAPTDEHWCFNPDGSIDNVAQTARWLQESADVLQEKPDPKDPAQCAGVFMMAGCALAFDAREIAKFTGLGEDTCKRFQFNLRWSKLLVGSELVGDLMDEIAKPETEQDSGMATVLFVLYCLVATGGARATMGADGQRLWHHTNDEKFVKRVERAP